MCCVQNTFISFIFCKSIAKLSNVFHGYPFVVPTCTCTYMATLTNVVGKVGPNYVMFGVATCWTNDVSNVCTNHIALLHLDSLTSSLL